MMKRLGEIGVTSLLFIAAGFHSGLAERFYDSQAELNKFIFSFYLLVQ